MAEQLSPIRLRTARTPKERLFQGRFVPPREKKIGTIVRALWPVKPALIFAQKMGTTERNALQIMRGERRTTLRAVRVIIEEIDADNNIAD